MKNGGGGFPQLCNFLGCAIQKNKNGRHGGGEEKGTMTVQYANVVDLLTDTIKELNQPCVEATPAAPVERSRTAEERKRDMADVLRGVLQKLEPGGAASDGAAAAAAAAEHGAGQMGNIGEYLRNMLTRPRLAPDTGLSQIAHTSPINLTLKSVNSYKGACYSVGTPGATYAITVNDMKTRICDALNRNAGSGKRLSDTQLGYFELVTFNGVSTWTGASNPWIREGKPLAVYMFEQGLQAGRNDTLTIEFRFCNL